jgi:class 3 adenylate cyclase/tetratricopeptide (TPR) repeat protein
MACAQAMLQQVAGFTAETPAGPVRLAMHIGLATGPVRRFVVGRPPYGRLDVLAGATVDRMAEAQHRASTGQVVVDEATAAALPASTTCPLDEGFFLLNAVDAPASSDDSARALSLTAPQVRPWLAETLYRRLRAGRGALAAELRLATPIFVNVSGLDYDADPDAGQKLHQYVVQAQEELAPYEGHLVAVTCGDKGTVLYVVFGAPIAHEDDPARAVGFALALREAVQALPFVTAQRIGISLGRAYAGILGSAERCTYSALGDEVNTSARLMQAAQPGQILASGRVQDAAADRYAFRSLGRIALKGKEEAIPIFEPLAVREGRPDASAEEPLVGRAAEQQAIGGVLDQVADGQGRVLLVQGEAGVGKSALVRQLLQQVHRLGWSVQVGSCLSYGQHIPYLPWRLILEEAYRLDPAWGGAERAAHLEEVVLSLPDPAGQPGYWQARFPLLAAALGLEVPDTPLTRSLEGELRRDNTFQLLEALVRALAASGPAVVVLEDASWSDELSRQLIAYISRGLADLPLLLVLVQRPPDRGSVAATAWQDLAHHVTMTLSPLAGPIALDLAHQRLDAATIPPELETLLLEKTQGNPFFVEELLRALQEGGYLQRIEHAVQLRGDWQALQLPDTIEGVVRARLDRLPEEAHLTLKVSSVIGRTFALPLLGEVHPGHLPARALARQLDWLEEATIVVQEEPAPRWRYAFQHPILHEVTYGTLLFAQRRQLHGEIGGVLEAWYAEDLLRVLDLLAYHYARSAAREKAVHYLQRAAEKARREYANEVALGYYNQVLERLRPEEVDLRYDLLAGRERIHDLLGEREAQEEDLLEMGRLAEALGDAGRQVEVLNRRARQAVDLGAFERSLSFCQQALALAGKTDDLPGGAEAQRIRGILHANRGEYTESGDAFHQALKCYRELGHQEGQITSLSNLGLLSHYKGELETALQFYHQALAIARDRGVRRREGALLVNIGMTYRRQGNYNQARAYCEQALNILREIGDFPSVEINLGNLGEVAMAQGDLEMARSYHQQALELARQLQDPEGEATSLVNLGLLSSYDQEWKLARNDLRAALRGFRRIGHHRGQADTLHHLGVLELAAGRPAVAAGLLRKALTLWQEVGDAGNSVASCAWLSLALLKSGEQDQARAVLGTAMEQLSAEGYGGVYPQQEVWWAAYQVLEAQGEKARAFQALEQAHRLVQEQAARIDDPARRQSFLERIPVNREIVARWGLEVGG